VKNRLEELRKIRGIKQEDLALELEVSRQTIGSLENGRYNPSIILAFKIAKFFELNIEDIFIYEEGNENEKK
jgi:predicted transcriptional regulators